MKIFTELPTALPFFDSEQKQIRYRENNRQVDIYRNLTGVDNLIPFIIQLSTGTTAPIQWELVQLDGIAIDISNNIPLLQADNYADYCYCYYKGETIVYLGNKPKGYFYHRLRFETGERIVSEVMFVGCGNYLTIEYWNDNDIEPIRYRHDFHQILILDTFPHTVEPEIEEEGERDGDNNLIPTFVKMTMKYKAEVTAVDYIKTALQSLQMHDHIVVSWNGRTGNADKIVATPQTDETGAFSSVILDIYTDSLTKGKCDGDKPALQPDFW